MGKYCRAGQATDDSIAHAHCMLDSSGYKHKLKICNTLLFHNNNGCSNATQGNVILVHTLPVLLSNTKALVNVMSTT